MTDHHKRQATGEQYTLGPDIDLDEEVVLDSRGDRITEARAEEMAAEALDYVERRGRKSLVGGHGTSPEVKARVPADLRDRLMARAKREHKRPSTVMREALEEYLA